MDARLTLRITQFQQHAPDHFTARVHANGQTVDVERKGGGGWHTADGRHEVLPFVAEALQDKIPARQRPDRFRRPRPAQVAEAA